MKQGMKDPREVAILALHATEKQGAWSDGVLKKMLPSLDERDSALATRLCFGVLQNKGLLDFYLAEFSNISLKRMESLVVQILRVALYELLFMDKIPENASVHSAVELAKKHSKRASGMVNGILRSVIRQKNALPSPPQDDPLEEVAILYSHPIALIKEFVKDIPFTEIPLLLEANNSQPALTAMVNTLQCSEEELIESLRAENVTVEKHLWLEKCLLLSHTGNLEKLLPFQRGDFYVQDPASKLAVMASGVADGDVVLDTCAAPGGKSISLAIQMGNQGSITACDLHPHKKKLIEANVKRLGLDCITAETVNAKDFTESWVEKFDLVFVDAPCSGFGVIAKKPDIRYKDLKPLEGLPRIQREILENVSKYVKKGGCILYSTCTIFSRENQDIVLKFCEDHTEFHLETFQLPKPLGEISQGYLTLLPHIHGTDGFFMAKIRRDL